METKVTELPGKWKKTAEVVGVKFPSRGKFDDYCKEVTKKVKALFMKYFPDTDPDGGSGKETKGGE